MDRMADQDRQRDSTISRRRFSPARRSRKCAAISAGRGAPACGCIGNWPGCACCFTGLSRGTPTISIRRLRLHAGKLAQRLDGLDHDIVELRERSRLLEEEIRFKMEEESNRHLTRFRDRDHAAAAADAGDRHLRHEHQGPAADRCRNRISLGRRVDRSARPLLVYGIMRRLGHRQTDLVSCGTGDHVQSILSRAASAIVAVIGLACRRHRRAGRGSRLRRRSR